jgi:plasmid stability protein
MLAVYAGTAYTACMQYTLRNIPPALDAALRRKAREEGRSLNDVAVEALMRALGLEGEPVRHRDLADVAGSWEPDEAADDALEDQRRVDRELWR